MKTTVCLLYASCIPVKGAKGSIICDLQRHNYVSIPNDLYHILTLHKGKPIEEIKALYDNQYDDIIDNYFQLLIDNEFAFLTDTPELFPEMSLEWDKPLEISNAIIDYGLQSDFDLLQAIEQLSDLHCKFIQFRFYRKTRIEKIRSLLDHLDVTSSNSLGIDFVLPYPESCKLEEFVDLFHAYKRVNSIVLYNSPHGKRIQQMGTSRYLIQMTGEIASEKSCGVIQKSFFSVHLQTFAEAQNHNSCLNGKISIDRQGMIRNCPSMPKAFGNIKTVPLKEALKTPSFKKYWNINKDQIGVCKDCEFRYICTDCRAYLSDPSDDKSKPLKCGYNPYTQEWKAWSSSHLKESEIMKTI